MEKERLQIIVEIGLAVALAWALNFLKLWEMPYGGSIALDMAPIMLLALRRGWKVGVLTGVLYGFANMLPHTIIVHPAQMILDYPLAFGLVGLSGLFASRWRKLAASGEPGAITLGQWTAILPAVLVGSLGRAAAHFVSGVIFFAEYAPAGQNPMLYSAIYNLVYLVPSALLCGAVVWIALPVLEKAVPATGRVPATS